MSIIANLMTLIEDERICIETTGCLRGHTKQDPGFYYTPYTPQTVTAKKHKINWDDVLLDIPADRKSPFEQGMIDAHRAIAEASARAIQAETDYLNQILAKVYSKPAMTTKQVAYRSHATLVEPGITINEYSY